MTVFGIVDSISFSSSITSGLARMLKHKFHSHSTHTATGDFKHRLGPCFPSLFSFEPDTGASAFLLMVWSRRDSLTCFAFGVCMGCTKKFSSAALLAASRFHDSRGIDSLWSAISERPLDWVRAGHIFASRTGCQFV